MRLQSFLGLFEGKRRSSTAGSSDRNPSSSSRGKTEGDAAAKELLAKDARESEGRSSSRQSGPRSDGPSPATSIQDSTVRPTQNVAPLDLDMTLHELARGVKPWNKGGGIVFIKTLQDAVRNHGRVDLMETGSTKIAVKRMPNRWMRVGPKEFREQYPTASERPWHDLGFVKQLNTRGFPYCCELLGVFRDDTHSYVQTTFATEGDLFGWCDCEPKPGKAREDVMMPLVVQVFTGVRWIHAIGISHRDLSLENILLTRDDAGKLQVKIIDFGMGTLKRWCTKEVRGKQSYQAPEMHGDEEYDAFLTDTFALGVVVFAMAVQDYPWISTKKGSCQLYEYVKAFGFLKLLERRKLRKGSGERLIEVLSEPMTQMLGGLLQVNAQDRAVLGEPCWEESRQNVWDMAWLRGQRAAVDPFPPPGQ